MNEFLSHGWIQLIQIVLTIKCFRYFVLLANINLVQSMGRSCIKDLPISFIDTSLCGFLRARQPELLGFFVGEEASGALGSYSGSSTTKSASSVSVTVAPTLSAEISCDCLCRLLLCVGFFGGTSVICFP